MSRPLSMSLFVGLLCAFVAFAPGFAQDDDVLEPRVLAPGVLKIVQPEINMEDAYTPYQPLRALDPAEYTPNHAPVTETLLSRTSQVIFRHDLFCYEFSFKPLRMELVDVPQPTGKMQQKVVWYMMYRIRNLGPDATIGSTVVRDENSVQTYDLDVKDVLADETLYGRFLPHFTLVGWSATSLEGDYESKEYLDRVIPAAVAKINEEEDPALKLHNSIEMSTMDIPPGPNDETNEGVWGVATWEDVDPRVDFCSVFVRGITNAYQMQYDSDGNRNYKHRTLQINFWRPGDTRNEIRDDIRYGIPLVDSFEEQVEITRQYGLPGPVIEAIEFDPLTGRQHKLFEVDGLLNEDLDSRLQIQMLGGTIPTSVVEGFANLGIEIPRNVALDEKIRNRQWEFSVQLDDETMHYRLRFTPKYWEKIGREIRYLDRLEHFWVYR